MDRVRGSVVYKGLYPQKAPPELALTGPRGTMASRAPAEGSVEGLVHSIQKSKTFKRLAGYSIECLNKLITPTASDGAAQCGLAVKLGATAAIIDVLTNPSTSDAVIFVQALKAVATLSVSSARGGQALSDSPAGIATIVRAFTFYWDTTLPSLVDSRKQLSSEDKQTAAAVSEDFATIMHTVAKAAPRVVLTVEGALSALCRLVFPEFSGTTSRPIVFHSPATVSALQALTVVRYMRLLHVTATC